VCIERPSECRIKNKAGLDIENRPDQLFLSGEGFQPGFVLNTISHNGELTPKRLSGVL